MSRPPERFERTAQVEVVDTGLGAAIEGQLTLADKLNRFRQRVSAEGGAVRARQGAREGADAGVKGPPKLQSEFTRYGAAFNDAALTAHRASASADLTTNLDRIEQEAGADRKVFEEKAEGLIKGAVGAAAPEVRAELEAEARVQVARRLNRVLEAERKVLRDEQAGEVTKASQVFQDAALAAARDGDEADLLLQRSQYLDLLKAQTRTKENPEGLIAPADAEKLRAAFETEVDAAIVVGGFERVLRTQGVKAAEKVREEFEGQKIADLGELTPDARDQVLGRMNALLGQEYARETRDRVRAEAAVDAKNAEIKDRLDAMRGALAEGYEVQGLDELVKDSRGTKMEPVVLEAAALSRGGQAFALLPPAQQERFLQDREGQLRTKEGGVVPFEVTQLQAFKRISGNLTESLNRDPMGTAVKQGIVDALPPLDFGSREGLQLALRARADAARIAESHYGRQVAPLTREEGTALGAAFGAAKASDRVAMLQELSVGLGQRFGDAMELVHKDGHRNLAWIGGLAQVDPDTAKDVLLGMDLTEADPKGLVPTDLSTRTELEAVRNAYPDSRPVVDAIVALYARKSQLASDFTGAFDADRFSEAVDQVTGGVLQFSNKTGISQFPAPVRGQTTSGDFEDWMDGLTGAQIEAMGGVAGFSGDQALNEIRERGRLVSVGPGLWQVAIPAAGSGEWSALYRKGTKPGERPQPFVLRWTEP